MNLHLGMRFLLVDKGETWELRKQTLMGGWLCTLAGPSCSNQNCPTKMFREFTVQEIWDNVVIDPSLHEGKWLGQMEIELLAAINSRLKLLNPVQRRSLLLAIRGHLDKRLSFTLPDEPSDT
jgi:hypothetical protein